MPTLLQKTRSLSLAVLSGKDNNLQAERDVICEGCDEFFVTAVRTVTGKFKFEGHCGACGCGTNNIADIYRGKNAWRKTHCPLLKWPGDLEGKGISLHEANTLYSSRNGLELSVALLQHHLDKGLTLRGRAEFLFDAHNDLGGTQSLAQMIERMTFYLGILQGYIDAARPLDLALLSQIRGPNYAAAAEKMKKTQEQAQAAKATGQSAAIAAGPNGSGQKMPEQAPIRKVTDCSLARRTRDQKRERSRKRTIGAQ